MLDQDCQNVYAQTLDKPAAIFSVQPQEHDKPDSATVQTYGLY
jgi:hypothetical protein